MGRHPRQRTQMAVVESGKPAITHYRIIEKFRGHTHIRVELETGRTHQIRVHMAFLGNPVLCDRLYSSRASITRGELEGTDSDEVVLERQALHARRIKFAHPTSGEPLEFEAPLPDDMQRTLESLRHRRG